MFDWIRSRLLAALHVPPEPSPPWGVPGSVRVFRAGRNYYRLRLFRWSIAQLATLIGIVFSLGLLDRLEDGIDAYKTEPPKAAAGADASPAKQTEPAPAKAEPARNNSFGTRSGLPPELDAQARRLARRTPWWAIRAVGLFEIGGVLVYLLQLPITYAVLRLDFEQRWYIVTDRSLRIRSGLVSVQESTMSFANLQQVTLTQGPLQRLLGLADVQVRSAGGGSGAQAEEGQHESMHVGVFHGVDNALAIRDLILERLRRFRAAGLGDPDDHRETHDTAALPASPIESQAAAAARVVLAEARAFRQTIAREAGNAAPRLST